MTPPRTTKEQREELRRLHAASTQTEWHFRSGNNYNGDSCDLLMAEVGSARPDEDPEYRDVLFGSGDQEEAANWEFIAAAHNALPALLADIDALEKRLEAAERDTARLDWLESQPLSSAQLRQFHDVPVNKETRGWRAAIDAAQAEEKG